MCLLENSQRISSNTAFALFSLLSRTSNKQTGSLTDSSLSPTFHPFPLLASVQMTSPDLSFSSRVSSARLCLSAVASDVVTHFKESSPKGRSHLYFLLNFGPLVTLHWSRFVFCEGVFFYFVWHFCLASAGRLNGLVCQNQHRSSGRHFC